MRPGVQVTSAFIPGPTRTNSTLPRLRRTRVEERLWSDAVQRPNFGTRLFNKS